MSTVYLKTGGTDMSAVSDKSKLQTHKLLQLPLVNLMQEYVQQGQTQGIMNGYGLFDQATFEDFEGQTNA